LLARLNPLAVLPTAILFGALDNGAEAMQRSQGISPVLVQVIQALVIMILLALDTPALARLRARKWREAAAPAAPIPAGVETPDA
jgi:ABC-type uncharacterized transport system permease subunit